MQVREKTVCIEKISFKDLPQDEQQLLEKAFSVRKNAQAPYSGYYVGAAILSNKGTTHVGCNVERCTWSQTTHAEQNAIDSMIAAIGPSKVTKLAVVAAPKEAQISLHEQSIPLSTVVCGHCLQIIWENSFQDPDVKILILESKGIVARTTIGDLLPFRFGPGDLQIYYDDSPGL